MAIPAAYEHPEPSEYAPYQKAYLDLVPEADILQCLRDQLNEVIAPLGGVPESRGDYAYAPGKWALKEVLSHMSDTERVLSYRALRIARGDTITPQSFDQDAWVAQSACAGRTLAGLLDEVRTVREATLSLFRSLDTGVLLNRGTTNTGNVFTVRAVPYIIAGHTRHHLGIIRERYL